MTCPINPGDWRTVKAWADGELEACLQALESDQHGELTAKLRGRIVQLRRLLAWGEGDQEVTLIRFDATY